MPNDVILFINNYGYLAIFILIFSQEIGIPNPVPNELVLIFSGYLCYKGIFHLPIVILTSVTADFIGTNILYTIFYFFGTYILQHKPAWLLISQKKVDSVSERILKGGLWTIYLGRLTPFIRGYTSVIVGLLKIKPKVFLPIAMITATIWSSICVILGRILGPYWALAGEKVGSVKLIILTTVIIIFVILIIKYYTPSRKF